MKFGLADGEYGKGQGTGESEDVNWQVEFYLEREGYECDEENSDRFDDEFFADFDVEEFVAEFADENG